MIEVLNKKVLLGIIFTFFIQSCLQCDNISKIATDQQSMTQRGFVKMDVKKNYIEISKLAKDASQKALSVTGIGGPVQSLPLPIIDGGNLKIVFIYFPFHVSSQSVYPPRFKSIIDAASGELEEIKSVTPRDFGMAHQPNELLGHRKIIEGLTFDQIEQRRERLYQLYDFLLPEFAVGRAPVSAESRILAIEFKELFIFFCPAPIVPYCEATGREYFSWIDRITS